MQTASPSTNPSCTKNVPVHKTGRQIRYEWIRIVAMVFVVAIHVEMKADSAIRQFYLDAGALVLLTSIGLFFLLSGKFALRFDEKEPHAYGRFYRKKLTGLIVPILLYMLIRTIYDIGFTQLTLSGLLRRCAANVLDSYVDSSYWFLYTLLGSVLVAPFTARIYRNLTKREMWIFVLLGLGFNTVTAYLPLLGHEFTWEYPFGGWIFYFMLGPVLEELIHTKKQRRTLYILGACCFILSLIQIRLGIASHIHDLAPTFTVQICAMFFFLRDLGKRMEESKRACRVIRIISRHCLSVYMLHNIVLLSLQRRIPFTGQWHFLFYWFVLTLLAVTISWGICFCIDTVYGLLLDLFSVRSRR